VAYFVPCSDCSGTSLLDGEPCIYCDGLGERPERQPTDAERRAAVRRIEAAFAQIAATGDYVVRAKES
jgi:hypothetical protein